MNTSTISIDEQKAMLKNAKAAVSIFSTEKFGGFFSKEELEDIVGDTMLKASRFLDTYNTQYALSTWVSKIAVNCVYDAARAKFLRIDISEPMIEINEDGGEYNHIETYGNSGREYEADRNVDYADFERSVRAVTDSVEGKTNRLFLEMIEEGLPPREMAARTGCTADAAAIRKCKILKGIKEPIRQIALEFDVHNAKLAC